MRIQVVSPWYPEDFAPYSGIFVRKQVEALAALGHEVHVEVPIIYPAPQGEVPAEVFSAMNRLADTDPLAVFGEEREVTRVPSPVPSRSGDLGRAAAFERSLGLKRTRLPVECDVTHAHLGVPTGLALVRLGVEPLVVTEHQSTLDRVFAQPGGIDAYEEVVESVDAFICVSDHLKERISRTLDQRNVRKIEVVPNIVDLQDISFRMRSPGRLKKWIYVGTIATHKGIELLAKAFKLYREEVRDATLTIVGDGPQRQWVERFAAGSGMTSAIRLVGPVLHELVGGYLGDADVLVHLSEAETFGISTLEAIGAGLPVVSLSNGGAESAWGDFEPLAGRLLPNDALASDVADAVRELEDDGSSLDSQQARSIVEDRFSPESVASTLSEIYERVR